MYSKYERGHTAVLKGLLFLIIAAGLFLCPPVVMAEPEASVPENPAEDMPEYGRLRGLVDSAAIAESKNLEMLKSDLEAVKNFNAAVSAQINAYDIQLSAHSNLLILPHTPVSEIEKAWAIHQKTQSDIARQMEEARTKFAQTIQQQKQTDEHYALNEKQIIALLEQMPDNPLKDSLSGQFETLNGMILEKRKILGQIEEISQDSYAHLKNVHDRFSEFSQKVDHIIRTKKIETLFRRDSVYVQSVDLTDLDGEMIRLVQQARYLLSQDWATLKEEGYFPIIGFVILFAVIQYLLIRLRRYCQDLDEKHRLAEKHPWPHMVLNIFCGSIPLLGSLILMYAYANARKIYAVISLCWLIVYWIGLWLLTRWEIDLLVLWNREREKKIPEIFYRHLFLLIRLIRYYVPAGIIIFWVDGGKSQFFFLFRLGLEVMLLIWILVFFKKFQEFDAADPERLHKQIRRRIFTMGGYAIVMGGILLELTGYGSLAMYWYLSWMLTVAFLMWAWLLFKSIQHWGAKFKAAVPEMPGEKTSRPLQWLLIKFSWLAWAFSVFFAVFFAWHVNKSEFFKTCLWLMQQTITVGEFQLNLLTILYAMAVILFTHTAVKTCQKILLERFLAGSGLDAGMKNSIVMITGYTLWFFGIMITVNILGVSSSSLAVAFGGLGIGLAFGLQAIFNNFFSGIILLFERPIQVGDIVEVGGIWGEVRKINVRATLVQTYDNATMIIPNSEFISSSVTNWSFKDKRIRRNINVGVAYGSDVERVRTTLLEIADSTEHVLKYPRPSVLFTDFGDNSLNFRLRIWTDVDNNLMAETNIRFQIDRLFRERGIEIPFPQRDFHLRSVDQKLFEQWGKKNQPEALDPAPAETPAKPMNEN
jgi:small-conductance mechanosensitive channel